MKIERIDDKTVKCFLSNEELEEYDIDYKDFVTRSEKAKEIVQEIIEQAEEEVGYKPPRYAFDLQIMMLPEQGLVLTFSEKDPMESKSGEQILDCLRDMKQILQQAKEKLASGAKPAQNGQEAGAGEEAVETFRPEEAIFAFERVADVMDFANAIPGNLRVDSALYSMNDMYYLHIRKGKASYERYSRTCIQAIEFAVAYTADKQPIRHLEEHGECLIAEKALKKLR